MIYVDEKKVRDLLGPEDCLKAIEEAYAAQGANNSSMIPRVNLGIPGRKESIKILTGSLPERGIGGSLIYTGGYPGESVSDCRKLLVLFELSQGRPVLVAEAEYLSWLRTGATGAVAAKYMANPAAKTAGILGTGRQGEAQLLFLTFVRHIESVKVYSLHKERREAFAKKMAPQLGISVEAVERPEECAGEDIVVTATKSHHPVLFGHWLRAGTHVNAIGAHYPWIREIDDGVVVKSRVIVVDSHEQAREEKGDLLIPLARGIITDEVFRLELGDVVTKRYPGRVSSEDITLFCSGGIALEYLAAGALLLERLGLKIN